MFWEHSNPKRLDGGPKIQTQLIILLEVKGKAQEVRTLAEMMKTHIRHFRDQRLDSCHLRLQR